ncbi:MAG: dihydrofolate reductase [Deltaproteobacteria bacterium]|nr:dihydrofolate reductase [Deltaproteobacteria bacterium]MCB9785248.1 dihydrofolate reductase [Deltaproteobacteria bacterium]
MSGATDELAPLVLVVAVADNGVIGAAGELPWDLPEDLRHFRRMTVDHAVIMGRRTWETLPGPLPRRRNIVVTGRPLRADGVEVAASVPEAIALARQTDPEPRVVGGAVIYAAALPVATRIHLTEVHATPEGDTFFPPLDRSQWREVERVPAEGCTFVTYERRS